MIKYLSDQLFLKVRPEGNHVGANDNKTVQHVTVDSPLFLLSVAAGLDSFIVLQDFEAKVGLHLLITDVANRISKVCKLVWGGSK